MQNQSEKRVRECEKMFLSHKSPFLFLAKFDDHIYPFACYNRPKQLSEGKKGLHSTLSDPKTSSDPDAVSDPKSVQNCSLSDPCTCRAISAK